MDNSNAAMIRKAYDDFAHGNIADVFAAFDPNITWHIPGHSPLSGDFTGYDQIGSFFQRTIELSGGAFSIDVHNVLADSDVVVAWSQSITAKRVFGIISGSAYVAAQERKGHRVSRVSRERAARR